MDTKNVIAAISLSAAVIIFYSLFFAPEPDLNKIKKDPIEKTKTVESSDTPSLDKNENFFKNFNYVNKTLSICFITCLRK